MVVEESSSQDAADFVIVGRPGELVVWMQVNTRCPLKQLVMHLENLRFVKKVFSWEKIGVDYVTLLLDDNTTQQDIDQISEVVRDTIRRYCAVIGTRLAQLGR